MNSTLRWNLLLGCAVLAVLQLPDDAEVLAHDLEGPYCTTGLSGGAVGDSAAASWQTAANDFDPARIGADSEALLEDVDDNDRGSDDGAEDR